MLANVQAYRSIQIICSSDIHSALFVGECYDKLLGIVEIVENGETLYVHGSGRHCGTPEKLVTLTIVDNFFKGICSKCLSSGCEQTLSP